MASTFARRSRAARGARQRSGAAQAAQIELRGVTKRFGSHTVLKNITFDVPRGKISAVLGPSGTGKSISDLGQNEKKSTFGEARNLENCFFKPIE